MGICSKLALFEKVGGWKVTDVGNVKKNQIINWINFKKEAIRVIVASKEIERKLIAKKTYLATKIVIKGINREKTEGRISLKTKTINRKEQKENAR